VIFIKGPFAKPIKIGYIEKGLLVVQDFDNYHQKSKSLGLDKEVVFNDAIKYHRLRFMFHGHYLWTFRDFFAQFAQKRKLWNGRDMIFLPLKSFGLGVAFVWKTKMERLAKELATKEVFDLFEEQARHGVSHNKLFKIWQEEISNIKTEENNGSQTDIRKHITS
jgi:(p)ppGpp synthase/HD superfamily hydrolase